MKKKPVSKTVHQRLGKALDRKHKKWCGQVERSENGYCSAVVPLFYANVPDHMGRIFTKEALQALANQDPQSYRYDEDLDALVGTVGVMETPPSSRLQDVPMVPLADLPGSLLTRVMTTRDDLANTTDARTRHLVVPYTKVWILLCQLLASHSLSAEDLSHSLEVVGRVGNDPEELIHTSIHAAGVAHGLMQQLFSPYDPNAK